MGSAKSDGTLKHSDSFTWYEELRNWDPMNFLMSQNGGAIATTRLGSGRGHETCSDWNEGTQGRQHRSGE